MQRSLTDQMSHAMLLGELRHGGRKRMTSDQRAFHTVEPIDLPVHMVHSQHARIISR